MLPSSDEFAQAVAWLSAFVDGDEDDLISAPDLQLGYVEPFIAALTIVAARSLLIAEEAGCELTAQQLLQRAGFIDVEPRLSSSNEPKAI